MIMAIDNNNKDACQQSQAHAVHESRLGMYLHVHAYMHVVYMLQMCQASGRLGKIGAAKIGTLCIMKLSRLLRSATALQCAQ